jgi:hypothetical protein
VLLLSVTVSSLAVLPQPGRQTKHSSSEVATASGEVVEPAGHSAHAVVPPAPQEPEAEQRFEKGHQSQQAWVQGAEWISTQRTTAYMQCTFKHLPMQHVLKHCQV